MAGRPEGGAKEYCATGIAILLCVLFSAPALAACPIELSVYRDRDDIASLEFRPRAESAAVTNMFKMVLPNDLVFDGIVMWTEGVARPNGILMHKCPEGDVTGEEIAACTLWEGVIYTSDDAGKIGLLPAEGVAAPKRLIFSDLAYAMQGSPAWQAAGPTAPPFDVFELKGCQE